MFCLVVVMMCFSLVVCSCCRALLNGNNKALVVRENIKVFNVNRKVKYENVFNDA